MSIPDPVFSWNLSKHYVYRQDLKHDLCEFKQVYHLELALIMLHTGKCEL